jgi:hypothetical protein
MTRGKSTYSGRGERIDHGYTGALCAATMLRLGKSAPRQVPMLAFRVHLSNIGHRCTFERPTFLNPTLIVSNCIQIDHIFLHSLATDCISQPPFTVRGTFRGYVQYAALKWS